MAPNTQDEQVKTSLPDIETNDRLQLKADGYLWQKVNRRLAYRIQVQSGRSKWKHGPWTIHFRLNPNNNPIFQGFFSNYQHRVFQKWSDDIYQKGVNLVKAEQAGVETGSKMIAVRDRYRTDLVCRVENMSSCMPNIKGMVTSEIA